eukprot:scaffold2890_cov57-Attheya_sp.AAC.2
MKVESGDPYVKRQCHQENQEGSCVRVWDMRCRRTAAGSGHDVQVGYAYLFLSIWLGDPSLDLGGVVIGLGPPCFCQETNMMDQDLGEMFLNFMLDPKIPRPYAARVDLSGYSWL